MENIDYENLRKDLTDYFGTATTFNPAAFMDVSKVERASKKELINIAINNGFDLSCYKILIKKL